VLIECRTRANFIQSDLHALFGSYGPNAVGTAFRPAQHVYEAASGTWIEDVLQGDRAEGDGVSAKVAGVGFRGTVGG
jgi:hypothetical protein